ncbi:hypothetical protein GCM10027612_02480 [Microbispora bryophytorum subsp. camponoti]
MASLHGYLATAHDDGLQIHLYAAGSVNAEVAGGAVQVDMRTEYPWQGRVELTVTSGTTAPWTLALRVPAWCDAYTVRIDGGPVMAPARDGYIRLTRAWAPGTTVVLDLEMPVRQVTAHPRVDAVRGCVALARGPLVYCLEQADLPPGTLLEDVRLDLTVPAAAAASTTSDHREDLADIPVVINVGGVVAQGGDSLYATGIRRERPGAPLALTAVPYFLWGNRSEGPMRVWIPVAATE